MSFSLLSSAVMTFSRDFRVPHTLKLRSGLVHSPCWFLRCLLLGSSIVFLDGFPIVCFLVSCRMRSAAGRGLYNPSRRRAVRYIEKSLKLTRFFPFGTENWTLCALYPECARSSREAGNHAGSHEGRAMRTAGTNCEDCSRPGGTVEFHVNIVLIIVK